jgi:hypothetical protein
LRSRGKSARFNQTQAGSEQSQKTNFTGEISQREYCLIARCLIGGKERERLEQSAKMQFYLDSGNKTLIAEANEWAAANPGCLPFSLELAFQEGET